MLYKLESIGININFYANFLKHLRDTKKKILYFGWLGHQNLGDEALFYCIKELFEDGAILYPTDKYVRLFFKAKLKNYFQGLMLGGGTLINRNDFIIDELLRLSDPCLKHIVFGTGVANEDFWQQFEARSNRNDEWKDFLLKCDFVGVRGPVSLNYMKGLGIEKAMVIGDPVLYLGLNKIIPKKKNKRVGINFGQTSNKLWGGKDETVNKLIYDLVRLLHEKGWTISLFNVHDKDLTHILQFIEKHRLSDKINIFDATKCSVKNTLAFFENISVFIGEKLHSSVFAACSYTPFIMLEYRPKCFDFTSSIGYERYNFRVDQVSAEQIIKRVGELYENIDSIQLHLFSNVQFYKDILKKSVNTIISDLSSIR